MAFTFARITGGDITLDPPTATIPYRAEGAPSPAPGQDFFDWVAAEANSQISQTYVHTRGTIFLQDIQIHENYYAREYQIIATYGRRENNFVGSYQITVDQSGGTVHVTAGTRIAGFGVAADAVDNGGLIGVDGDKVEGVDIPVEVTKIVIGFRHPTNFLTAAYVKNIGRLVGFPNNDTFLTYDPGEVLYLGGQFSASNTESSAQYNFAVSYNRSNLVIGGITITTKAGWDVISPTYKAAVDNGHGVRKLQYVEIIRPAGREFVAYKPVFGWG